MWWKFKKGEPIGKLRVDRVQIAWYDMENNGYCFDESFLMPQESDRETLESIGMILPYVETIEDESRCDRSRVFVYMDNGDCYELQMRKLSNEQQRACSNFYGGRE